MILSRSFQKRNSAIKGVFIEEHRVPLFIDTALEVKTIP